MRFAVTLVLMVQMFTPCAGYAEPPANSDLLKSASNKSSVNSVSVKQEKPQKVTLRTVKVDKSLIRDCEHVCRMTDIAAECIHRNCKASIAIPDRDELVDRAIHFANTRYRNKYTLLDVQTYVGVDEIPVSYLVILGKHNETPAKKLTKPEILSQILAGKNPAQWDNIVVWLDMSTDARYSPIRSSGVGVPAEWLALKRIKQIHNMTGEVTKRYFSALSPVLEFKNEKGERFFYQHIMPGKLASSIQFRANSVSRAPSKSKAQWLHFINQAY